LQRGVEVGFTFGDRKRDVERHMPF
jgi:hypothetical protein